MLLHAFLFCLVYFVGILHILRFEFLKFMIWKVVNFHPCIYIYSIWAATWDFQQFGMCVQQRLRSAFAYAHFDQSLCWSLEYTLNIKLLTEYHLEVLSLKGGCTGSFESTLVKMSQCWKSHVTAHIFYFSIIILQISYQLFLYFLLQYYGAWSN